MSDRKAIAVIVGFGDAYFANGSLQGIIAQARRLGYDVMVFSMFIMSDDATDYQLGEENIYNLLMSDRFAGYVLVGYTFWAHRIKMALYEKLGKAELNLVLLDEESNHGFTGVVEKSDRECFAAVTDHLIEAHGRRRIYCMTGPAGFEPSEARLLGYRDSMERHGLYYDESYFSYGDFSTSAAAKMADRIANGELPMPDGFVCGNDTMAIALTGRLIARGIRVPEDVAVAGYDLGVDAMTSTPSITSYIRPLEKLGSECVCLLHERYTGLRVSSVFEGTSGRFVGGESCGCEKDSRLAQTFDEDSRRAESYLGLYRNASVQERLVGISDISEIKNRACQLMYLLYGCKHYAVCLNIGWDDFREDDTEYLKIGYTPEMTHLFGWHDGGVVDGDYIFHTRDVIPPSMLPDEPVTVYISPLHFKDRSFGYEIIRYERDDILPDRVYQLWSGNLNMALEYMRVSKRMDIMYRRAVANSLHDGMTGLYNRRGYSAHGNRLFRKAVADNLRLMVVAFDLDGLKFINDNHGHHEGDNAIIVMSDALQSSCSNDEFCFRLGGDEFAVIGCGRYGDDAPQNYIERVRSFLSRYNQGSDKPYRVEASVGAYLGSAEEYSSIEDCIRAVDQLMYSEKRTRKSRRAPV